MIGLLLAPWVALADEPASPPTPPTVEEESMRIDPVRPRPWLDLRHVACRYGVGLAAGTYDGNVDWDNVGSDWGRTVSPLFEATCAEAPPEGGREVWGGVLTAPFYVQFRALDGEARQQWFSGLLGVTWGDEWRVGPMVVLGYPGVGGGLVARRADTRSSLDLRLVAYGPYRFGAQAQVAYGFRAKESR